MSVAPGLGPVHFGLQAGATSEMQIVSTGTLVDYKDEVDAPSQKDDHRFAWEDLQVKGHCGQGRAPDRGAGVPPGPYQSIDAHHRSAHMPELMKEQAITPPQQEISPQRERSYGTGLGR